jgi:hypothetical protein
MDYPRLRDPLLSALAAVICFSMALAATRAPDWLRMFLTACGIVFATAAVITGLDFVLARFADRLSEIDAARTAGATRLASAMRGLTMTQTDFVMRQSAVTVSGLLSDVAPMWVVRGPTVDIPLDFIADFLEKSAESYPYLWPERKAAEIGEGEQTWSNARQYCVEATNLIVSNGWAQRAVGPYAAMATVGLDVLRAHLGVGV